MLVLVVVLNILETRSPQTMQKEKTPFLSVLLVVLNILGARSQQTVQILKQHILLGLLVVTNIVQTRSQQRMQKKTPFCYGLLSCSTSWKQEASKPCRKKSAILLRLVVVLNILENKKPANHAATTAPFC